MLILCAKNEGGGGDGIYDMFENIVLKIFKFRNDSNDKQSQKVILVLIAFRALAGILRANLVRTNQF